MFLRLITLFRRSGGLKLYFVGVALGYLMGAAICFSPSAAVAPSETPIGLSSLEFRQMALMPFLKGQFESPPGHEDKPLSQPLTKIIIDRPNLRDDADQELTRLVAETLKIRFRERLIPVEESKRAYDEIGKDGSLDTPRKLAKALGEKLQAELVVVGSVWRYRERGEVPDAPASVAFEVYLVEVASGKRLWRGKFDRTQRMLSEDVLGGLKQMKMGVRWFTADELARYGVKEIFDRFPLR